MFAMEIYDNYVLFFQLYPAVTARRNLLFLRTDVYTLQRKVGKKF